MSSIQDQDQIETFLPGRANPAFRESVGIGGFDGSGDNVETFGLENSIKSRAKRAIMVMDQEAQRLFSLGKRPNQLSSLLSDPNLIGMGGDTSEMNLARAQFDEEEHVDGLQPDGFHGKKVTGQDLFLVMGHELPPTNGAVANRSGENAVTVEDVAHGCQGNLETQFEQFTHNLAITEAGVLSSETENETFNLLADC